MGYESRVHVKGGRVSYRKNEWVIVTTDNSNSPTVSKVLLSGWMKA